MSSLWYDTPCGNDWNRGLPVGNGTLGAMILAEERESRLQLNEDSIWNGGPKQRINNKAYAELPAVRKLIREGDIPGAERLLTDSFSGVPESCRAYSLLGWLRIHYEGDGKVASFRRELNLSEGVYTCVRSFSEGLVRETILADYTTDTLVIHIAGENGAAFSASCDLNCLPNADSGYAEGNTVYAKGTLGVMKDGNPYRFVCGMRAFSEGGKCRVAGRYVRTCEVSSLTLVLACATTYRCEMPESTVEKRLAYSEDPFAIIAKAHAEDYKALFARTQISLPYDTALDAIPTDRRLAEFDEARPDLGLVCTYFDYGRYLLISSSRKGSLPANLQGIWNPHMDPPWGSKYTININLEMNYWPAERLGLSECAEPLFSLMRRMAVSGAETAQKMYGCRGIVAHHNTDLWGDTAPQDEWIPGTYWVMGMAWLCTHIRTHYRYCKDIAFLRENYNVLREAAAFFLDFCEITEDGISLCPSVSPENTYILSTGIRGCACKNSTMDLCILRDLLTDFLAIQSLLGEEDADFRKRCETLLSAIPPLSVGQYGQIMEWEKDYEEAEPGHRHISHLYALFPSGTITPDETPELSAAARVTLDRRLANGGGHTGWSRAWIINMFAHLWDGENCWKNLAALLTRSTLPNLLDNHPPFQIDGNFGGITGYAEMLLQSNDKRVVLLPALPACWSRGSADGIYAVGGARYDFSWQDGAIVSFTVTAEADDYTTTVYFNNTLWKIFLRKGESTTITG
ncbi:MAG: glycoside hydrolase family 95 protein [Lachnospiraceae bacterium]|nr:glycoside hydrolase family 95 protein [Lachnospiraceae bacterium]